MFDLEHEEKISEGAPDKTSDLETEVDFFASLNKVFEEDPGFKRMYESLMRAALGDDDGESETEVACLEIDGREYFIAKEIEIAGSTYLYLVNTADISDFMIQKIVVEDGEEYLVDLDSEKEFELVQAYYQRDYFKHLKEMLKPDDKKAPDDKETPNDP